jgi:hypothetical protein
MGSFGRRGASAWMVDRFSLGLGADQKYCRPAGSSDSSDQQLCLLYLRYRTGRQLSSLCRSTLWVESGRPNSAHSKSSRILSNGLWRGHGGNRNKRSLCPLDSIPASRPRPLSCSSHPPNASNLGPLPCPRRRMRRRVSCLHIVRSEGLIYGENSETRPWMACQSPRFGAVSGRFSRQAKW